MGKKCSKLPVSIIKRLPVRFTYDNNFFNAKFQGIPLHGYTQMIENIITGTNGEHPIEVVLEMNFLENTVELESITENILYTGPIDAFFNYKYGQLDYRSLKFKTDTMSMKNYQGVAVKNFTGLNVPWTRVIEHKHFMFDTESNGTIVTYEFPDEWEVGKREYYPIRDEKNLKLLDKYLNECPKNVFFGGRLGRYEYNDMDVTIRKAIDLSNEIKI